MMTSTENNKEEVLIKGHKIITTSPEMAYIHGIIEDSSTSKTSLPTRVYRLILDLCIVFPLQGSLYIQLPIYQLRSTQNYPGRQAWQLEYTARPFTRPSLQDQKTMANNTSDS